VIFLQIERPSSMCNQQCQMTEGINHISAVG